MFGLGMPEILLILAIALIVIGPKKLPELAKTLGRALGEFKRSAQDLKRSIDIETTVTDTPPPATDLKTVIKDVNTEKISADDSETDEIHDPFDDKTESDPDVSKYEAEDPDVSEQDDSEPDGFETKAPDPSAQKTADDSPETDVKENKTE